MLDRRRYLGTFAVFALVLLRLVIGWHFLREGAKKLEYDRRTHEVRMVFSSEGFLKEAKGRLASLYHAWAPDDHGWRELLALPRKNAPPSAVEMAERAKWSAEVEQHAAEAKQKGETPLIEISPFAPYHDWALRIGRDWKQTLGSFERVPGLTDDQKERARKSTTSHFREVADYLAGQSDAITEYQHELWRLQSWRDAPEAGAVPFVNDRIATKNAEIAGRPAVWVNQVREFENDFHDDLRGLVTTDEREQSHVDKAVDDAIRDPRQKRLHVLDLFLTGLTMGVGVCLVLGMLTSVASLVGAMFLLAVIASQPPWLADAAPTMPQVIECAALLLLAGARAGRWAGLDYFTCALFNRRK